TIITAKRDDVLRVPVQAPRFNPRQVNRQQAAPPSANLSGARQARVWVIGEGGSLRPVSVETGLDDGNFVEILGGDLKPGDNVVTGEVRGGATDSAGGSTLSAPVMRFPH
ncbi:MAG TPA: hypothetical protein VEF07_00415, partial [Candidatus Binataceae bacterium]|nr:hypothetical protein [Candidatus Binataceae bacterium]